MANRKQISQSAMRGDKGVALIHRIVNDMGFVWNPISFEAGIDGLIEVRDATTEEASNCIIQVQSKAGKSYFRAETESSFEYICDERDLTYWLRGNTPVILVVSRPEQDEAYWISLKDYFRDPKLLQSRRITFSKDRDRFEPACCDRLAALALPPDAGKYLTAPPQPEVLVSNLLPVASYPHRIFCAETTLRYPRDVCNRLNETRTPGQPEWLLHNGCIYAFYDLTIHPWNMACKAKTAKSLATMEFATSDDPNRRYVFRRLAERCLSEILHRQRVRYCNVKRHYYFQATPDLSEYKINNLSVFRPYASKTHAGHIAYYRHRAAELRFVPFNDVWYVEIAPTYRFTQDGWKQSRYADERLFGIKQLERQNKTHLRQVRLWEEVLRQVHLRGLEALPPQLSLFANEQQSHATATPYTLLTFNPLVRFDVDWSVPETAWLAREPDKSDNDTPGQLRLFER